MIAVSILALTLGTYAIGFKRGYRSGHVDGYWADRSAEFGTDSVRIEHLRTQDGFLDSDVMINEIRRNVLPTSWAGSCLLYTSPSPRDRQKSRMPSSA